mgnify:CR=1 FL=1
MVIHHHNATFLFLVCHLHLRTSFTHRNTCSILVQHQIHRCYTYPTILLLVYSHLHRRRARITEILFVIIYYSTVQSLSHIHQSFALCILAVKNSNPYEFWIHRAIVCWCILLVSHHVFLSPSSFWIRLHHQITVLLQTSV